MSYSWGCEADTWQLKLLHLQHRAFRTIGCFLVARRLASFVCLSSSCISVGTSQNIQATTTGYTKSWECKISQHRTTRVPKKKTKEPWARQGEACDCWRLRNISESRKGSKFERKNGGRELRTWQRTTGLKPELRGCLLSDDGKSCLVFRNQRNKEVIQPSISPPRRLTKSLRFVCLKWIWSMPQLPKRGPWAIGVA